MLNSAVLQINEQGTAASLSWNVAGKSELALLDLPSGRMTERAGVAGGVVGRRHVLPRRPDAGTNSLGLRERRQTSGCWT